MTLFRKNRFCAATFLFPATDGDCDRSAVVRKLPSPTVVPPASGALFASVSRYARTLLPTISTERWLPANSQPAGDSAPPAAGPGTTCCGVTVGLILKMLYESRTVRDST